jgi:chemotaxis protein methyltransferase WspC
MKRIEHWLRDIIGLDAASVGSGLIDRAVRHRVKSLGLKRIEDYAELLLRSTEEAQELVEAVVITETWFFREPEPFQVLAALMREDSATANGNDPRRILSVPCASGEEPFSLVMALRDAEVPVERFQIEAMDVSPRALSRAARGVYPKNSFRGRSLAFRSRYFQHGTGGFAIDPTVREAVRFSQGNLLSEDFPTGDAGYDFVFCRNLLIYLAPSMRRRALCRLESLLAPAGVLFVGLAEQALALEHGYVGAKSPASLASCQSAFQLPRAPFARLAKRPRSTLRIQPAGATLRQRQKAARTPPPAARSAVFASRSNLEAARRLADAGRLPEAAAACEAYLRESRTCAQGYYVLGLVREASGGPDAIECYRKALYLEPNHYESLLRMARLFHENGQPSRARTYAVRAERVKSKT